MSGGALRGGDVEGEMVLFERNLRGTVFWLEDVQKFVIAWTDPFRGVSLFIYKTEVIVKFVF